MCQVHNGKKSNRTPHLHGAYVPAGGRREETSRTASVPDDGESRAEKGLEEAGAGRAFLYNKGCLTEA